VNVVLLVEDKCMSNTLPMTVTEDSSSHAFLQMCKDNIRQTEHQKCSNKFVEVPCGIVLQKYLKLQNLFLLLIKKSNSEFQRY